MRSDNSALHGSAPFGLHRGPSFEESAMVNFGSLIRAFDAVIAFTDAARKLRGGPSSRPSDTSLATTVSGTVAGQLEARLTNVVVAALKEAFDRDHARLELERAQLDEQRRRAEEAMRLELRRQAADRELGRLRLLAATALVGWLASVLVLGARAGETTTIARVALGGGWLLLLGALAFSFTAQGRISAYVPEQHAPLDAGRGAAAALWLLVAGLASTAISLLLR
jgi:hypothetical protein